MRESGTDVCSDFDAKVISLIAQVVPGRFRKKQITRELHLQRDLGLDSLVIISLVFYLEEAFAVDLSTVEVGNNLGQMRTVDDAINVCRRIVQVAKQGTD